MKSTSPALQVFGSLYALEHYLSEQSVVDKHLFCFFQKEKLQHHHLVKLVEREIKSVSFENAHTIYPYHPLTQLNNERQH
ncbi:hypothetical protein [Vibrio mediterranei]|uniref:Uncharacterized protein n=1 Tax=Vibrio mediterranei TaxID=689 RepID=A0ABX5DC93_9VIBR|nr:hypothetical protein [Vibrio mediterranei]PCD85618.1 hypothetical protein COR52_25650 [Vibrio mediterranei]PRQ66497.1 hypothetical protein COR51_16305 [Vibrio mediterranei]